MTADLTVSVLGGGALLQIHTSENGVLAKFVFDLKHRLLHILFPY